MAKAVFRVVVKGGKGSREAVVRPPSDRADPPAAGGAAIADAVTVKNRTDMRIWVRVPAKIFDLNGNGAPDANPAIVEIPAKSDALLPVPDGGLRGSFAFQVFCEETFSFAQGNSDPEFIIEN